MFASSAFARRKRNVLRMRAVMPEQLMAKILVEWRDAERLLEELPPLSPDHETVRLMIAHLRVTYASLSATKDITQVALDNNRRVVAEAHELLEEVHSRQTQRTGSIDAKPST